MGLFGSIGKIFGGGGGGGSLGGVPFGFGDGGGGATGSLAAGIGAAPKRGLFGLSPDKWADIADLISSAQAGFAGDPVAATQIRNQHKSAREKAEEYQQHRQDEFDDWQQRQQYSAEHSTPETPSIFRENEMYQRLSPEDRANFDKYAALRNPMAPIIMNERDYQQATPAPQSPSGPPAQAVALLRANPEHAAEFDRKYGAGAAARALGGASPSNGSGGFPGAF